MGTLLIYRQNVNFVTTLNQLYHMAQKVSCRKLGQLRPARNFDEPKYNKLIAGFMQKTF